MSRCDTMGSRPREIWTQFCAKGAAGMRLVKEVEKRKSEERVSDPTPLSNCPMNYRLVGPGSTKHGECQLDGHAQGKKERRLRTQSTADKSGLVGGLYRHFVA